MSAVGKTMLSEMMTIRSRVTRRVSSWDRTGGNRDFLLFAPGERKVIADIKGAGIVKHLYLTTIDSDPLHYRKVVVRMFWDGEETPSVEVPLGDLFGAGFCRPTCFQSLLVALNPGFGNGNSYGFNLYLPMPFANGARIEVENESELFFGGFWYHLDYDEETSVPDHLGRLHAQWRRENPCQALPPEESKGVNLTGADNYRILEAKGAGNYVGCFLNVDNLCGGWYGEGDDMIFVDGDAFPPRYHGTGTEEVFGGGACPDRSYFGPYTGFHMVSNPDWSGKQSMYRFHVLDPVCFHERIEVGVEHGHANDLANDYSSTAFWYQHEPHAKFPPLPAARERLPRFPEEFLRAYGLWTGAHRLRTERGWPEGMSASDRKSARTAQSKFLEAFFAGEWEEAHAVAQGLKTMVDAAARGGTP